MIKVYSSHHHAEILVNESRILYVAPSMNGTTILHLDTGEAISIRDSFETFSDKVLPKVKVPLTVPPALYNENFYKADIKTTSVVDELQTLQLHEKLGLTDKYITDNNLQNVDGKLYPDEFPDHFPRFKSGKICTTSKLYLNYMKEKENA